MPEYLYHYTSINTLALILSTKSIKLSPLNSVDDLTETLSADEVNFGQYVFVTCWTSDEEESIPFWKMYTPDMTGVRLKFPKKMFQEYEFYSIPHMGIRAIEGHTYATHMDEIISKNYMVYPEFSNNFYPIEYVTSVDRISKKLHVRNPDGSHNVAFGELGKTKSHHWQFQKEWRHKLIIVPSKPFPAEFVSNRAAMDKHLSFMAQFVSGHPLGLESYFLKFSKRAFESMEILLGPKQNEGDALIVESLRDRFNPGAKIIKSSLSGSVR